MVTMRKKATNCIGAFSIILNNLQLQKICQLLIKKIKSSSSKGEIFTMIQTLGQVSRSVGHKIHPFLGEIIPLVTHYA
jgi:hypothetical protein